MIGWLDIQRVSLIICFKLIEFVGLMSFCEFIDSGKFLTPANKSNILLMRQYFNRLDILILF